MSTPGEGPQIWAPDPPTEVIGALGGDPHRVPGQAGGPASVPDQGEPPARHADAARAQVRADYRTGDIVRDVIAVVALGAALLRPWDYLHGGFARPEVVAATVLAMATLGLPYAARAGALPATWTVHRTRRARVIGTLPYFLVVFVSVVIDVVAARPQLVRGGLGTGVALGLAGAVLASQARASELGPPEAEAAQSRITLRAALGVSAIASVLALVTVGIVVRTPGFGGLPTAGAVLGALVVIGLLAFLVGGTIMNKPGSRLATVGFGGALGAAFALGSGTISFLQMESTHMLNVASSIDHDLYWTVSSTEIVPVPFVALLIVPTVAALVAAPVVAAGLPPHSAQRDWLMGAVRSFDIIALLSGFLAIMSVLGLAHGDTAFGRVLTLIATLLVVVVALIGRMMLRSNGPNAHPAGVLMAVLVMTLGGVVLGASYVVMAYSPSSQAPVIDVSFGTGAVHLVAFIGLPLGVIGALTIPRSMRGRAQDRVRAYTWEPPAPRAARTAKPQPSSALAQHSSLPDHGAQPRATSTPARRPQTAPTSTPHSAPTRPHRFAPPERGAVSPPTEQVAGFSAEQAADPATSWEDLAQIVQDAPHLRPQVAANPSTYPALLEWLGSLGDPAVDEALRSRR